MHGRLSLTALASSSQVSCERALLHSALSDVALLHGEGMAAYIQLSGGMAAWVGDSARPASGSG